jgi:hypothetical protein
VEEHHPPYERPPVSLSFTPEGQWLASGGSDHTVRIWETESHLELWQRDIHEDTVNRVQFGPGSRTLLSCGDDAQVFLWNLRPPPSSARPIDDLWRDLASADGPTVFRAIWAMSEHPDAAKFLREKIAPAAPPDNAKVQLWLQNLGDPKYPVREEAQKQLAEYGDLIVAALNKALAETTSAETRRRIIQLQDAAPRPSTSEQLRQLRAAKALQLAATKEARAILESWSQGFPDARLTRVAKEMLKEPAVSP